jgi:hypothetical protein
MSSNDWEGIQYDKIPSKAGLQYRKAFFRHDENRYRNFLSDVAQGKTKINAGTLYPYEIVEKCYSTGWDPVSDDDTQTLDAMWNNLPNYFNDDNNQGIVVADVSGSMSGRPLDVSISLAMYVAERNKGEFHNKFITFSEHPSVQTVKGKNIVEKVNNLKKADWDMTTNLESVFNVILDVAVEKEIPQHELPTHLYIVSDMQFNKADTSVHDKRFFDTIKQRYEQAGYQMPFLVFWNVRAVPGNQPMSMDERGFQLVSGCSPAIFSNLLTNQAVSAYDLMLETINSERYACITM